MSMHIEVNATGAIALAAALDAAPNGAIVEQPIELGAVHWRRGFDAALASAKEQGKPLLVLFQEVPGCHTCVSYGRQALRHPLLVEAAETLFVPVAVYNNIKGDDERTLKQFNEPAWNNPVVRIVSAGRRDLVPRLADDYTAGGLAGAMIRALEAERRPVPAYLKLLAEEATARSRGVQRATFAMHCFWEGEGALGGVAGVVETAPGFVQGMEVVDVRFDPAVVSYEKLLEQARGFQCASRVFTHDDEQQRAASSRVGAAAVRSDESIRPDREPKYYLSRTPMRFVPMIEIQAARVNAAIGAKQDPLPLLSPRQLELLAAIEKRPGAKWPNAIGADFCLAWNAAATQARMAER